MDRNTEINLEKKVSKLSIFLVLIVFSIKIITIFFTNSLSFMAEFTDSIMDFVVVAITYFALKNSRKPADYEHMFGHAKANSFAGLVESLITIGVYLLILYSVFLTLVNFSEYEITNPITTVASLCIIVVLNLIVSTIIKNIGKKTNNATIRAQSTNFRGDLFRNIAIILGLIFAIFNVYILDPILAGIFSIKAIIESIFVIKQSYHELMDYNAIDPDRIKELEEEILLINGVLKLNSLAIRTVGSFLESNVVVSLDTGSTLNSTRSIKKNIRNKIFDMFPEYHANINVQINSQKDHKIHADLFDIIKRSAYKSEDIKGIHGITLDLMDKEVLIQFHALIDPMMTLGDAHEIISNIEETITNEILKDVSINSVSIKTHIEPYEEADRSHNHNVDHVIDKSYDELICDTVMSFSEIKKCDNIRLLNDEEGNYLTLDVKFDKDLKIQDVHWITEEIEFSIKGIIPHLKTCTIHSEPF